MATHRSATQALGTFFRGGLGSHWASRYLKKMSHRAMATNAARQGYVIIPQVMSFSCLRAVRIQLTEAATAMPVTKQMSQAGKNEPRMLNEGARPQPASAMNPGRELINRAGFCESCTDLRFFLKHPWTSSQRSSWCRLGSLDLNQIAGAESQIRHLQQQLRTCQHIL